MSDDKIRSLAQLGARGRRMSLAEYGARMDGDIKDAEIERLRAVLMQISQYETSAPAGFEWDIVVEELVEIARNALKVKP